MNDVIKLKNLELPRVVQSPMANCTDLPFRLVARSRGMKFAYLEMISADGLMRDVRDAYHRMQTIEEDAPVGAQIVGCDPDIMGEAAAKLEDLGFPLIDMNLGCPVPKVVCKGGGSQLLREPELCKQIFTKVVKSVKRAPVTVKMRLGYSDASGAEAALIARTAEDAGVNAVAVHGRTRSQQYSGQADYVAIGRVKRAVSIPVYGNGDVVDAASARRLLEVSGCDGVMLGRGALGNPWIYRQIEASLNGEEVPPPPTFEERKRTLLEHIDLVSRYGYNPTGPLRRIICWYFKEMPGVKQFRDNIHSAQTLDEMRELVERFQPMSLRCAEPELPSAGVGCLPEDTYAA